MRLSALVCAAFLAAAAGFAPPLKRGARTGTARPAARPADKRLGDAATLCSLTLYQQVVGQHTATLASAVTVDLGVALIRGSR